MARTRLLPIILGLAISCGSVSASQTSTALTAGSTFRDCPRCPRMVVIPPASFQMGMRPGEMAGDIKSMGFIDRWLARRSMAEAQPQHLVDIQRRFALGQTDVTRREFAAFIADTGYVPSQTCSIHRRFSFRLRFGASWKNPGLSQTDSDPVVCVSWQDAQAYVAWLNTQLQGEPASTPQGRYSLPSEAEWEYAARAGTQTARWWGNSIGSGNADCDGCGSVWDDKGTAPSGSFPKNPFGLEDMLGNVSQWMEDCRHANYHGAPSNGAPWMNGSCESREVRGGDWTSEPWVIRSAVRMNFDAGTAANFLGFRVEKNLR